MWPAVHVDVTDARQREKTSVCSDTREVIKLFCFQLCSLLLSPVPVICALQKTRQAKEKEREAP